jgi:hypothetical protein
MSGQSPSGWQRSLARVIHMIRKGRRVTLAPITSSHQRRPVPMADMDPGLRQEDN